jgi:predicted ABC-type ATPase
LARYPRTLANLKQAVRMADAALLYDTGAGTDAQHLMVAACRAEKTQMLANTMPNWAKQVLGIG